MPAGLKRLHLSVERCERPAELHLAGCAAGLGFGVCVLRSQRFSACRSAGCNFSGCNLFCEYIAFVVHRCVCLRFLVVRLLRALFPFPFLLLGSGSPRTRLIPRVRAHILDIFGEPDVNEAAEEEKR